MNDKTDGQPTPDTRHVDIRQKMADALDRAVRFAETIDRALALSPADPELSAVRAAAIERIRAASRKYVEACGAVERAAVERAVKKSGSVIPAVRGSP